MDRALVFNPRTNHGESPDRLASHKDHVRAKHNVAHLVFSPDTGGGNVTKPICDVPGKPRLLCLVHRYF